MPSINTMLNKLLPKKKNWPGANNDSIVKSTAAYCLLSAAQATQATNMGNSSSLVYSN